MESHASSNPYGSGLFAGYGQTPTMVTTTTPAPAPRKMSSSTTIWIVVGIVLIVLLLIGLVWMMWPSSSTSTTNVTIVDRTVTPPRVTSTSTILGLAQTPQVTSPPTQNSPTPTPTTPTSPPVVTGTTEVIVPDTTVPTSPPGTLPPPLPPVQDPLADISDNTAMPSIWIGSTSQTEDSYLVTPDYGYFYPRNIRGRTTRPVVDVATVDGTTLYAHVSTPGMEGIYRVPTNVDGAKWELYLATGSNTSPTSQVGGGAILDTSGTPPPPQDECAVLEGSRNTMVTDLHANGGNLYAVTESGIYEITPGGVTLMDGTKGILGGDAKGGSTVYLTDGDTLVANGSTVATGNGSIRDDVPSYVKYVDSNTGIYAMATRDLTGQVGYSSGKMSERFAQIPGNIKAFTATDGYFCCVDTDGRVIINEYDAERLNFKYPAGIPYNMTVPVDNHFKVVVAMGGDKAYIFSSYKEGQQKTTN